jgi:hypothetical protein
MGQKQDPHRSSSGLAVKPLRPEKSDRGGGALMTMSEPRKSNKPLILNEMEKRRNHRQNSSKLVKTWLKLFFSNDFQ